MTSDTPDKRRETARKRTGVAGELDELPVQQTQRAGVWTVHLVAGEDFVSEGLELFGRTTFREGCLCELVTVAEEDREDALLQVTLFPSGEWRAAAWALAYVEADPGAHVIRIGMLSPALAPRR